MPRDDHRLHVVLNAIAISHRVSALPRVSAPPQDEDVEDYDVEYPYIEFLWRTLTTNPESSLAFDGAACVRLLLEHVDVDAKVGDFGWTQLHVACLAGRMGVAKVLLAHGADPFCADSTVYDSARRRARLRTDRSAWLDWFDIDKYKKGQTECPCPARPAARRPR